MSNYTIDSQDILDLIDCLTDVNELFNELGYNNPTALLDALSPAMSHIFLLFAATEQELLAIPDGDLILDRRSSVWVLEVINHYLEEGADFDALVASAHNTYKRIDYGKKVRKIKLYQLNKLISDVLEIIVSVYEDLDSLDQQAALLFEVHNQVLFNELSTEVERIAEDPNGEERNKEYRWEVQKALEELERETPVFILFVESLRLESFGEIRIFTLCGFPPYHPWPLGINYNKKGYPLDISPAGNEIKQEISTFKEVFSVEHLGGELIVGLWEGYNWEEGDIESRIFKSIAERADGHLVIVRRYKSTQ